MRHKYKFNGKKCITEEIKKQLPSILMYYLWHLIEEKKKEPNIEMDYMQVFELTVEKIDGEAQLVITHSQEQPIAYQEKHYIKDIPIVIGEIFVIDDVDFVTMLWDYEY